MAEQTSTPRLALEVEDLDSCYGELQVLRGASLKIRERELVALFGPNGHGKSTLLKTICGIQPPKAGSIRYRGREISGLSTEKTVEMGLAYIPEGRNLFADMTVLDNLILGAYNRPARQHIQESLDFVFSLFPHLEERKSQLASTLSGGEGRMLAVGRGLMSRASLLLIDEPSIGLSPLLKEDVFEAIDRIRKTTETTILLVEQEVEHPLRLADKVYLLRKGQIILEKRASEITRARIEEAYF